MASDSESAAQARIVAFPRYTFLGGLEVVEGKMRLDSGLDDLDLKPLDASGWVSSLLTSLCSHKLT